MSSKVIDKQPCDNCRSQGKDKTGNNLHVYDDNHAHCHACGYHVDSDIKQLSNGSFRHQVNAAQSTSYRASSSDFIGEYKDIPDRMLSKAVCQKIGIKSGTIYNKEAQLYEYDKAKKIRILPKQFAWIEGESNNCTMLGLDQATDYTAPIIITEGELDAASCWEVGYQACSIHAGASLGDKGGSTKHCIEHDKEKLLKFNEIWLWFDNDESGQAALKVAKELLPIEKVRTVECNEFKDANDALRTGKILEILSNNVKEYRPEGIIFGNELQWDKLWENPKAGLPLPWKATNDSLNGLEYGQFYMLFGGSSIGKSSVLRELVYHYRVTYPALKIANIFLEENQTITPMVYIALHANIPIGKLKRNKELIPTNRRREIEETLLNTKNLMFINEIYKRDSDHLVKTIEYLVKVKKFDLIILDHISYVIGRSKVGKNGERRDIDELLYILQDLTRSLNCIILAACHLTNVSQGPGWDEGKVPGLYNGRGSGVLAQVPDGVIAVSRNMKDQYSCDLMKLHVLKNRWDGKLGETDTLIYFEDSGRLLRKE